jgi:hypothetical protein
MLTAALLLTATPCRADDGEMSRRSLRGLSGVGVLIEDLDDDAKRVGLSTDQIQTDVELKLRLAGIKVLTKEERYLTPGHPYLYVNLYLMPGVGLYPVNIVVELNQNALLTRDSASPITVVTWSTNSLGTAPRDTASTVRRYLSNDLDRFLNAYLSVNPKK